MYVLWLLNKYKYLKIVFYIERGLECLDCISAFLIIVQLSKWDG